MSTIDQRATAIARAQHGAFSLAQLGSPPRGVSYRRARTGRWEYVRPGVYAIVGSPDTWERRLWVALLGAGEGAAVGRRAAARLHGLPGFGRDHIDIVQPERSVPRAKPRTARRSSQLPPAHLTEVMGFPVTTVPRTIFDLAGLTSRRRAQRGWVYLPAARIERVLDDSLVGKRTTIPELTSVLIDLAGHGRPGTQLTRQLLEARSSDYVPTESELEALFARMLDQFDLPTPRRQVVVGDEDGPIGRVDFLFERAKLIVELDGHRFHAPRQVRHADLQRDLRLAAAGWRVIRLGWWQMADEPARVAGHIRGALAAPARSAG